MAQLIPAAEAFEQSSGVQKVLFEQLEAQAPFVVEQLNQRIIAAVDAGTFYIELTREEIESVPDTTPDIFVAYLQDKGYSLTAPIKGKCRLYFHNPYKD